MTDIDYRSIYFEQRENRVCEKCWTDKELQVHHINKNHWDNRIENLMLVCCECHSGLHKWDKIYQIRNWKHKPRRSIPFREKEYISGIANTKLAVKNALKNRIFNRDKEKIGRIYFQ